MSDERNGDPGDDASSPDNIFGDVAIKRRFESHFRQDDYGCWVWTAHVDGDGYGQFKIGRFAERAHRASWRLYKGPIEPGLDVDHKCHKIPLGPPRPNRKCVNPEHLEPVTHAENMRRKGEEEIPPYATVPITADLILEWVDEMVETTKYDKTKHIGVYSAEGEPWRAFEHHFEQGLVDGEPMALAALYLYTLQLGVNWKTAAVGVLGVNPLSLKHWMGNEEWRKDYLNAKSTHRLQRWLDVEDSLLDVVERRAPTGPLKDVVSMLKHIITRQVHLDAPKGLPHGGGSGAPQLNGPTVIINVLPGPEQKKVMGDVVDALYHATQEQLPPPEHWETTDEEVDAADASDG